MDRAGFVPSLAKEGWREAPGWFEAVIPQLRSDSYIDLVGAAGIGGGIGRAGGAHLD